MLEGAHETITRLGYVATVIEDIGVVAPAVFDELEHQEERLFEFWDGKYVRTGRTKNSLTERNVTDAVRRYHGTSLDFGTTVEYANLLPVLVWDKPRRISELFMAAIVAPAFRGAGVGRGEGGRFISMGRDA
jgi:hypothetical protein